LAAAFEEDEGPQAQLRFYREHLASPFADQSSWRSSPRLSRIKTGGTEQPFWVIDDDQGHTLEIQATGPGPHDREVAAQFEGKLRENTSQVGS
jgi:hypothetical protein